MKKAFTLIEVMIVVAIIALLAALSIPVLSNMRIHANEAMAVSTLNTILNAQQSWRGVEVGYANSLGDMANATPPYIDSVLGGGSKSGYNFQISFSNAVMFVAVANPIARGRTGNRSFCVSDDGATRYQSSNYSTTLPNCTGTMID